MLLALDAGNTNITIGAFDGERIAGRWRLRTIREQTADEWGILMRNLFSLSSLGLAAVDGVVISSVVPAVDQPLTAMAERYFKREPMFVSYLTDLGISVRYDNPREVGADRLVNAVAGFHKYGGPCVSWISAPLSTSISFRPTENFWVALSAPASACRSRACSPKPRGCRWWIFASRKN